MESAINKCSYSLWVTVALVNHLLVALCCNAVCYALNVTVRVSAGDIVCSYSLWVTVALLNHLLVACAVMQCVMLLMLHYESQQVTSRARFDTLVAVVLGVLWDMKVLRIFATFINSNPATLLCLR
jgi:hypothetical protein